MENQKTANSNQGAEKQRQILTQTLRLNSAWIGKSRR